jgi:cytochrome c
MPTRLLIAFAATTFITFGAPVTASAQNASSGRQLFQSRCSICHSAQPGRIVVGPSLFGVVGRHSGRMPGFEYSAANLQSNLTWDPATLDRYLSNPQQLVPGTLMTFSGLRNPQQRADVIAYLETLR